MRTEEQFHFGTILSNKQTVLDGVEKARGQAHLSKVQDVECIKDENGGTIPFRNQSQQQADSLGYSMDRAVSAIASTATHQGGQTSPPIYTPIRPTDRAVSGIAATATRQGGHLEQQVHTPMRPMDRALFAIASTATHQGGHVEQQMHTPMRPMDRAVSGIASTATHQVGHFQQPLYMPMCPMDKVVFVSEPIVRYVDYPHQQRLCKHIQSNGNRESEATGALPNSHTSQQVDIRLF